MEATFIKLQVKIIKQKDVSNESEQKFEDEINKFHSEHIVLEKQFTSDAHGIQKCNITYQQEKESVSMKTFFQADKSSGGKCINCGKMKHEHSFTQCPSH